MELINKKELFILTVLFFWFVVLFIFSMEGCASHAFSDSGRADELMRFENSEVVCYSRRHREGTFACKWK
jgi:hypothetical protein